VSGDVTDSCALISVLPQSDAQSIIYGRRSKKWGKAILWIRTISLLTESEIMKLSEGRGKGFRKGKCLVQSVQKFVSRRGVVKEEVFGVCVLQNWWLKFC
jgi:hypothetical protein